MPCLASWNNSSFNRSCITTPIEVLAFRKTPWAALRAPQRGQTKPFRGRGRTLLHPNCETQSLPIPLVPAVKAPLECPQVVRGCCCPAAPALPQRESSRAQIFFTVGTTLFFICYGVYNKKKKKENISKKRKNSLTASLGLLLVFSVQCHENCICRRLTILFVLLLNYFYRGKML